MKYNPPNGKWRHKAEGDDHVPEHKFANKGHTVQKARAQKPATHLKRYPAESKVKNVRS